MTDHQLVQIVPSEHQLAHQQLEFYAFAHFTVNTYTDKEWGDGTEDPAIFNPVEFDADQWVEAVKSAGMRGLILTCKHHDGFCLWPSKYNTHNISASPYKGGKGNIVREVADACAKGGIKFGVYLSPWDRNSKLYGTEEYNDYFCDQLTELLTEYGEIFSVWFDGACGEGPNGKKQVYDWERYYALIRKLQPNACISVCGPDVRWCGNEAGDTRESEWSVVPARLSMAERVASASQQADNEEFRQRKITSMDRDLGSRKVLADEKELIWYAAEVNTSIRPGWFYHASEDDKVRSLEEMLHIYYNSVGGNGTFLLNLPPDRRGLIHENDVKRLKEIGDYLNKTFAVNLAENAEFTASGTEHGCDIANVKRPGYDTYYKAEDGDTKVDITVTFPQETEVSHVVLQENIKLSQRIESFDIIAADAFGKENIVYSGTVVGYKRIAKFDAVRTNKLIIRIKDSRVCPTLAFVGIY